MSETEPGIKIKVPSITPQSVSRPASVLPGSSTHHGGMLSYAKSQIISISAQLFS